MNLRNRALSNSGYEETPMQLQALEDKILAFVEHKFSVSQSYATRFFYSFLVLQKYEKQTTLFQMLVLTQKTLNHNL